MEYKIIGQNLKKDFIRELFENRGIKTDDIAHYLRTTDMDIQDPSALDNITEGCEILHKHLNFNNKILIVVDPDVDGLTSSATLWNFIKEIEPEANLTYVMHKGKMHGLTSDLYDEANETYDLIILPDAGSNQQEEFREYINANTDILIIDHHHFEEQNTKVCIINNQSSKNYNNKSLSGAGVVWQFIRHYNKLYNCGVDVNNYLDLVALGNVADVMDLRSIETKHMVMKGLENIKNSFFSAACKAQAYSMKNSITPEGVAWYIGPLLNAVVRVGTREEKEQLFYSMLKENADKIVPSTKRGHGPEDIEILQEQTFRICTNVRTRQNKIVDEGMKYIEDLIIEKDLTKNKLLLITIPADKLQPEVIGLVANKIASKYQQPTLVLRDCVDRFSGSGRNFSNSPIDDFRGEVEESGLSYLAAGHSNAWGCVILKDKVHELIEYFNNKWKDIEFKACHSIDFVFDMNSFVDKATAPDCVCKIGELNKLGLWGQGIPEPLVAFLNVPLSSVTLMSPNKEPTLKINANGIAFIKFGSSQEEVDQLQPSGFKTKYVNIIGKSNLNEWNGRVSPQIMIEEYEIVETSNYNF